jgi:mRNA interferase RelE/StbE
MIDMEIEFKRSALKQLKYYKRKNPVAYKLIRQGLEEILENPNDASFKKIRKYPKYKRARKGNYRICFKVKEDCVYIGRIEDRSKAYH